ncbi:unsaturated chondroitin disaccharide hydrolase [Propionibacterium cyclohexanicum]|uniref:Unsaturated chondroitin disaccharide hydrolase n=1 Tax=Propionibacterium cyclohexanicum TaxID=64702 RepID=A0A1H9U7S4_9ACTN|nr:glycoside hydrolase family 88 protein [Propionibacterium cyclohexanicum]SES05311.1 unsaturated chondroitin disaccharide hydrolase [Propionibacterium cyclohexanicum]
MAAEQDSVWLEQTFDKLVAKVDAQADRLGPKIPYVPENGVYPDMGERDIIWWTNGFWSGILWQLYHATGREKFAQIARTDEERLDAAFTQYTGLHHDVGFMWLHTAVADYRLTGNERSKARGLHAAHLLAGRYNPRGKFIRSWNRDRAGWIIVDSMLNIPLLYWARDTLDDPRFGFVAEDHADTVLTKVLRGDGSVNHIAVLDPNNGDLLETPGGQGFESGSSWSRGQAWALYGFALSYLHTGKKEYLDAAKRVAHYFIAQVQRTGWIPLVDFRAPAEPVKRDSSAGLCAACGLLEIAKHVGEYEKDFYREAALNIVRATEASCADWDTERDGLIGAATAAYHDEKASNASIIYGDYYFTEALLRLLDRDVLLW